MARPKRSVRIRINETWCKRCGICIALCPRDVFESDGGLPVIKDLDQCTGCMLCEHLCPDFAIEVEVEKKPAKEAQSGSGA